MLGFKQYIKESIDSTARVGIDGVPYEFHVGTLINHAEQKDKDGNNIYPVQYLHPGLFAHNIKEREGSENDEERTKNADVSKPIIFTRRKNGTPHVLDGTHRVENALNNEHETIPAIEIPIEHLGKYRISPETDSK